MDKSYSIEANILFLHRNLNKFQRFFIEPILFGLFTFIVFMLTFGASLLFANLINLDFQGMYFIVFIIAILFSINFSNNIAYGYAMLFTFGKDSSQAISLHNLQKEIDKKNYKEKREKYYKYVNRKSERI